MRGLRLTLAVSLGAHLAVAAAFVVPHGSDHGPAPDPSPQLAGETFELPAPESPGGDVASAGGGGASGAEPSQGSAPGEGDAPAKPARAAKKATRGAEGAKESAAGSTGSAERYGATGDRSASDLATAFTRGFPQAASADPAWRGAPLGAAGAADVVITLSESGHIESTDIQGSPSAALASGIRRTLALVKMRPFVARGKTTRLHVTATISSDAVHDGLHGDVFAIGGSFAGGEGNGFFALAIGRRIDLRVHAR